MISDVLPDAITEIDEYLTDFPDEYAADRPRILAVRAHMDALRAALDSPPRPSGCR